MRRLFQASHAFRHFQNNKVRLGYFQIGFGHWALRIEWLASQSGMLKPKSNCAISAMV